MFCNQSAFIHSTGCPQVYVDLSFPNLEYCTSISVISPVIPDLRIPNILPAPDISPLAVRCIEIDPITEVGTDEKSISGGFGLQSGVSGCESGKYKLWYKLNVGCPLQGLEGTKQIIYNGAKVGNLVFSVDNCSINIAAYASCIGGTIIETCIDRKLDTNQIDIPISWCDSISEDTFELIRSGCALRGGVKLASPHKPNLFSGNIQIRRQGSAWFASAVPHVDNCSVVGLSLFINIPSISGLGFTFKSSSGSLLNVSRHDNIYRLWWASFRIYTGPTGYTGATGTAYHCYSEVDGELHIVTCKKTGKAGIPGKPGKPGIDGKSGLVYKVVGSRGSAGIVIPEYGSCDSVDVYATSYIDFVFLKNIRLWARVTDSYRIAYEREYAYNYIYRFPHAASVVFDEDYYDTMLQRVVNIGTCYDV